MTGEHPAGRVLVVDDDRVNRMLLTRSLEREGHRVRCAEDGLGALEVLRRDPCDVVLLDIVMPELDGVSVLERIKSDPALQDVPVIMISGVDETESVLRCIELGAEDYLPKPFDPVLLRARISAGLTKKRLHELERERLQHLQPSARVGAQPEVVQEAENAGPEQVVRALDVLPGDQGVDTVLERRAHVGEHDPLPQQIA
jgi:DNA-binding response OmpR family regulator